MCAALLAFAASATATPPVVSFRAELAPLSGYPEPSDGRGTVLKLEYAMSGSGYGVTPQDPKGSTPPLSSLRLLLPKGFGFDRRGFGGCGEATLKNTGASGCPRSSIAGPLDSARGVVSFGAERVPEQLSVEPFFGPAEELLLYLRGSTPVSAEVVSRLLVAPIGAAPSRGLELAGVLPAIATVPGAPLMSIDALSLELGPAFGLSSSRTGYLRLPDSCPAGGFPLASELTFGGPFGAEREFGIPEERAFRTYAVPCPSRLAAPLLEVLPGTEGVVQVPSNKACVSRRDFKIHVQQIKELVYRRVSVEVNGRRVRVVSGRRRSAQVDLRGLPKGRYTVRITITTSTGRRLSGIRAYHTCAPKPLPGGRPRL